MKQFFLANKIAKSKIRRDIIKMTIKNVPDIYSKNFSKIKNKRLRKILNSDLASAALEAKLAYMYNNI